LDRDRAIEKEEERERVPARVLAKDLGEVVGRRQTPTRFQWVPAMTKGWTVCERAWRVLLRGLHHRLLPRDGEEGGWSCADVGELPARDSLLDSLRYLARENVREVAGERKGSRREEEERCSPTVSDLTGDTRRYCGASSRNSVGLRRNWRERKREAREVIGG
jgi:hypothetical protein